MSSDLESDGAKGLSSPGTLAWRNLIFKVPSGKTIIHGLSGKVKGGSMMAVMGPSGAGKSTFLDIICRRAPSSGVSGTVTFNGSATFEPSDVMSYVEQSDALIGVLTVRETLEFAAKLRHYPNLPTADVRQQVDETMSLLGLSNVASTKIGTAIQKGISGGQKRRVTIGCSVLARSRVLVLDEPTSGLDSTTSLEVVKSIKTLAQQQSMAVICTIHQPSWETLALFDDVLVLAEGKTVYQDRVDKLPGYLASIGSPVAEHSNPADHVISLANTEFLRDDDDNAGSEHRDPSAPVSERLDRLCQAWKDYASANCLLEGSKEQIDGPKLADAGEVHTPSANVRRKENFFRALRKDTYRTWVLMHRNMLNYRRNVLAYGIRVGMYVAMGVLLGTIWVNLAKMDTRINDRLSVHFFSVAFLAFMSVAGIPSFLEERAVFVRERNNGLYGPGPYVLANSLVNIPFLFICSLLFCVICYWSIGLHPGAPAFFRFLAFLFLAVYTAESQSILIAAIIPIFVAALAVASFLNGFMMSVQGYFIKAVNLPRFWYYWAHWIDYQTFAFNIIANNDLRGVTFSCTTLANGSCQCAYPTSLTDVCAVTGDDVLQALQIRGTKYGLDAGLLIVIAVVYRSLFYIALRLKKK